MFDLDGVDLVRFVFADPHGVPRGKTVTREALTDALRNGIAAPGSLLLKDTSGKTAFPVFGPADSVPAGLRGAADLVLVPDETTFRLLPWAKRTGWILCSVAFPSGEPVPFCPRTVLRRQLSLAARRGFRMTVGAELEFHVFRDSGAGGLEATTPGAQLLREESLDGLDDLVAALTSGLSDLGLPLRTVEAEFGANQLEVTLSAADASVTADYVVLCRSAVRQIARRLGYTATFMARPAGASVSAGWHLHQSLTCVTGGEPAFVPCDAGPGEVLSPVGASYLEGLLRNAPAATAFAAPTVNGYKRYQAFSLAPDRVGWGVQNRGCMVRVIGGPGIADTRLENRSGEPAANPYLYIASQLACGMAGVAETLKLRPPMDSPYDSPCAERLPRSLGEAVSALDADGMLRSALTDEVVDWYVTLKRAEFERYLRHVSDWEQQEYLGLF